MLALFFRGANRAINENPCTNTIDVNHIENTFRAITICFSAFSLGIFFFSFSDLSVLAFIRITRFTENILERKRIRLRGYIFF